MTTWIWRKPTRIRYYYIIILCILLLFVCLLAFINNIIFFAEESGHNNATNNNNNNNNNGVLHYVIHIPKTGGTYFAANANEYLMKTRKWKIWNKNTIERSNNNHTTTTSIMETLVSVA